MNTKINEFINQIRIFKGLPEYQNFRIETSLREDLELESFDLAELTVKIEDEFGVDIYETGLISTYGEILNKLNKN